MRIVINFTVAIFLLYNLSGCETARGFGKDMEKLGKEIQEAHDEET